MLGVGLRVAVGFADTTCPSADKGIVPGFGMTHSCFGKFYEEIGNWLRK